MTGNQIASRGYLATKHTLLSSLGRARCGYFFKKRESGLNNAVGIGFGNGVKVYTLTIKDKTHLRNAFGAFIVLFNMSRKAIVVFHG